MSHLPSQPARQPGVPAQAYFNRLVSWLLGSPFHGLLSKHLMLLEYTGVKSGLVRRVPITYHQEGQVVTAFCNREVAWWKNLRGGVSVQLLLRGHIQAGIATAIIDDPGTMTPAFIAFLRTNRQAGGFQAVPLLPDGEPDREAVARVLPTKVMVQIALA
jgi:hypothetical protein